MRQKKEFLLTSEGFLELETELNNLKNDDRPRIIEAIKEARAKLSYARISSRKVKIVIDLIRNKSVGEALAILKLTPKAGSEIVEKLLLSAMANAENNHDMDVEKLYVAEVFANQGPTLKRVQPRAQGRAFRILKRTSHITLVLKEKE
jgi:large subunit ribosomal protein L22